MSSSRSWFSLHTHSAYSPLDGIGRVEDMVRKARGDNRPALGLSDHGNMAGTVALYKECKNQGIIPFPGVEAYLIEPDYAGDWQTPTKGDPPGRFHIGLYALDLAGYKALVRFVSLTHTRPRFSRFPRCTLDDLAQLSRDAHKHVALTTGCFFGYPVQNIVAGDITKAERIIKTYAAWFPHTFVELQNHNITHDQDMHDMDVLDELVKIASMNGLPVVGTQDSHYPNSMDRVGHNVMKRMTYGGAEDEFPGDSFHVASADWMQEHFDPPVWTDIEAGHQELLDLNRLAIPPLDTFKVHVPDVTIDPEQYILDKTTSALSRLARDGKLHKPIPAYTKRIDDELNVINALGFAGFFTVMVKCVEWCRSKNIAIEARGSANGSLVCYLLGITQVDPIKWGTVFERFMSRDRIKPPDIDIDIEDSSHERVMQYMRSTYGAVRVGTWSKLGVNADGEGSVMVTYKASLRRKCEELFGKDGFAANYPRRYGWIQTLDDVARFNSTDHQGLVNLDSHLVHKSYGVHPGGVIIPTSTMKVEDWIPTMLVASSNQTVTQYDGDAVEEFGFVKQDWLGQATLRTMRVCQELMGRKDPTDFGWIPDNDPAACALLRDGRTDTGIFHFEGYTKARGGRELGVRSTKDATLVQALYMPGAMDTGQKDLYIKRRKDMVARSKVTYIHPVFEHALKDTYGAVVFQEQVLAIMQGIGMSVASFNLLLKLVKDSGKGAAERNVSRMASLRSEFDQCCGKVGITDRVAAWDQIAGFIGYGFNRAHAVGYGIRSYRCAYLKAHHPLEFMTALLMAWAGRDKEKLYVREAKRIGIRILPPDVNLSGRTWRMDPKRNAIRRALVSIKGIGDAAADEIERNAPYTDIDDFIDRNPKRVVSGGELWRKTGKWGGNIEKLHDAGALDSLLSNKE